MTREQLVDLVWLFLEAYPEWVSVNEDTGGWGLCADASGELALWLEDVHRVQADIYWLDLVPRIPNAVELHPAYPMHDLGAPGSSHCIVYVDGYVVDLTARQYDEKLPFPFIWKPGERDAEAEEQECPRSP